MNLFARSVAALAADTLVFSGDLIHRTGGLVASVFFDIPADALLRWSMRR